MQIKLDLEELPTLYSIIVQAAEGTPKENERVSFDNLVIVCKHVAEKAASQGLRTEKPLSVFTQALKGHGKYLYETGEFFANLDLEVTSDAEAATATAVPTGETGREWAQGTMTYAGLLQRWLDHFSKGDWVVVSRDRAPLFWKKAIVWLHERTGIKPKAKSHAIIIPRRAIIDEETIEEVKPQVAEKAAAIIKERIVKQIQEHFGGK